MGGLGVSIVGKPSHFSAKAARSRDQKIHDPKRDHARGPVAAGAGFTGLAAFPCI